MSETNTSQPGTSQPVGVEPLRASPGGRLRALLARPGPALALPGVFNALTARMAARAGFEALYVSGAGLSAGVAALPDVGLLTLTEFATQAGYIAAAVETPVIADADTGFGEALNVERCVRHYAAAGLAGLHLEDQRMPKRCGHLSGKSLVSTEEMAAKVRAAVAAAGADGPVVIARTDARGVTGYSDAVARARAYREAGAEMIFAEALTSREEFAAFAADVPSPLMANMTEFGQSPALSVDELSALGYRAVLFPMTAFRVAMRAAGEVYAHLRTHGVATAYVGQMQTRAELYELLDYEGYEARDRVFFGEPPAPKPARS